MTCEKNSYVGQAEGHKAPKRSPSEIRSRQDIASEIHDLMKLKDTHPELELGIYMSVGKLLDELDELK